MSQNNKNDIRIVPKRHWPHLVISTGFFTGYWPWGPGTLAGFFALLIWVGLSHIMSPMTLCATTILLNIITFFTGIYTDNVMERYWGDDPRTVVVDEFQGTWIAVFAALFCPDASFDICGMFTISHTTLFATIGFILFRIIDITKPLGCRWLDKHIHGGLGCMLDDILAGFYALILTLILRYVLVNC